MNIKTIWYAALHEMRILRRLLRAQIFIFVALCISAAYFMIVTLSHMHDGSMVPMLSVISPRYVMSFLSGSFIALFCVGISLLTFDQIKRDEITRIHEVMNSKPNSDLEVFTGRLIGLSIAMAVPMLMFLLVIMVYGMIADVFSIRFGEPVELWSVVSFVLLDIAPNFVFFGSLVILFSLLLRSRLLALLLSLGCLFALFWLNSRLSLEVSRPLQTVTGNVLFPSELVPTLLTPMIVANRIALLLMGVGFLCWSSCLVARVTSSRSRELVVGSLSVVMGLFAIGAMYGVQGLEHSRINHWVKLHDEHFQPSAFPDVHKIVGNIDIKPGRSLVLDLTLDVSVDLYGDSDFILFSLNPGYTVSNLVVSDIQVTDHKFQHGLLKIPAKYFNSGSNELKISAKGRPDKRFAYLDSVEFLSQVVGPEARQLQRLGSENSIFRAGFVVLPPGIKWYPTSGTSTNEDAWELRKQDFFLLDLTVSVPRKWLVAGPAPRESLGEKNKANFRFQQSSPLPEFALVAAKFESASIEVEGVLFECLYTKTHRKKIDRFFAAPNEPVRVRLKLQLDRVRSRGLDYPYGSFTLVEVPSTLRVFGGGIEMDTVMSPPGLAMIRESTLPTTTTYTRFEGSPEEVMEELNATVDQYVGIEVDSMGGYIKHPMFESNGNHGFYRSLLHHQTGATHDGARSLNILLELMVRALQPYSDAHFDVQIAKDPNFWNFSTVDPIQILRSVFSEEGGRLPEDKQRQLQNFYHGSEVWDEVASIDMLDVVDDNTSSLKTRALKFRAQRLEQFLRDSLGSNNVGPVLVDLLDKFRGRTFNFDEFKAVVANHGVNLDEVSGDLINSAELPGFFASSPSLRRLESQDQPKYESTFILHNNEPVSGPVKLSLTYQNGEDYLARFTIPAAPSTLTLSVGGYQSMQVAIESSNPVQYIWVEPYLSLNRTKLRVDLPQSDEFREQEFVQSDKAYIKSITEIDYSEEKLDTSITIDDLDPGFSIVELGGASNPSNPFSQFLRALFGEMEIPMDQGLPKYTLFDTWDNTGWSRWTDATASGTYRRTFTIASRGDGRSLAKFHTTIPDSGKWELKYHIPAGHYEEEFGFAGSGGSITSFLSVGRFYLDVQYGTTILSHSLDAPNLTPGWHSIAKFDLPTGEVDVMVSNKTDELYLNVIADAIQWTPVETEE